ncbi:MAG: CRISPR-associated endonuclease Cas1 [Ancrocorticia sp.]|uniref:CRISPR-associated endonuclease Cas1 n=1 Tax=Ancrocorticia sp. TaxID=2593684 RepID=UPI003F9267D6
MSIYKPPSESLPISLVIHTAFCPRRAWLESAGEKSNSYQLHYGTAGHKRLDNPSSSRPTESRAREVHSERIGVHGRCDLVRQVSGGVEVVETKTSPVRKKPEVTSSHRIQLALQKMCLEEAGEKVVSTKIRFSDHHDLVDVPIDTQLLTDAEALVAHTRNICDSKTAPPPLIDDRRCSSCSHIDVCLPDERKLQTTIAPRIHVRNPDASTVHLVQPGSRASIKNGRMVVKYRGEELGSVPMERISGVVVHGNVDISSALIRELHWKDQTIVWCSGTGRVYGWSQSGAGPNGVQRVRQHVLSEEGCLPLAREMISAKISNQTTLLRRNGKGSTEDLRRLQSSALRARSRGELFGIEGSAASLYFSEFESMLKQRTPDAWREQWNGRTGRHAQDPINAMLNYAYGILLADVTRAVLATGLDPHAGFLHSSSRNKPALALDLMEEFRAPIADSTVISALNSGALSTSDISTITGEPRLTPSGRKKLVGVYEKRVSSEFRHPLFGYSVSWRRAMEIQARLVLGFIDGTQSAYKGIKVR